MIEVEYDLKAARLAISDNPYERFADLLPVRERPVRLRQEGYTPLVHAHRLGRELGLDQLYLKDETRLPTRTTKDRMAAVSLAYMHERGVRTFCASSTGNSSTGFAYAIRDYPDMRLCLFTAELFVPRVQHTNSPQVRHFGMRDSTFVQAAEFSAAYARQHGLTAEGGFFNPGRREGLKLAFLEACDQIDAPIQWYVQAVSSAMGVYGVYKGAKELTRSARSRARRDFSACSRKRAHRWLGRSRRGARQSKRAIGSPAPQASRKPFCGAIRHAPTPTFGALSRKAARVRDRE